MPRKNKFNPARARLKGQAPDSRSTARKIKRGGVISDRDLFQEMSKKSEDFNFKLVKEFRRNSHIKNIGSNLRKEDWNSLLQEAENSEEFRNFSLPNSSSISNGSFPKATQEFLERSYQPDLSRISNGNLRVLKLTLFSVVLFSLFRGAESHSLESIHKSVVDYSNIQNKNEGDIFMNSSAGVRQEIDRKQEVEEDQDHYERELQEAKERKGRNKSIFEIKEKTQSKQLQTASQDLETQRSDYQMLESHKSRNLLEAEDTNFPISDGTSDNIRKSIRLGNGNFLVAFEVNSELTVRMFDKDFNIKGVDIKITKVYNVDIEITDLHSFEIASTANDDGFVISSFLSGDNHKTLEKVQKYDSDGKEQGDAIIVDGPYKNNSVKSFVPKKDGGFIVVWESNEEIENSVDIRKALFAQEYDANSIRIGDRFEITKLNDHYRTESITILSNGNIMINFSKHTDFNPEHFSQIFDANFTAIGSEFLTNFYSTPSIIPLDDKFFVAKEVIAYRGGDGYGSGIFSQIYHNNGTKIGEESQVNSLTNHDQSNSEVTQLSDGFIVSWRGAGQDSYSGFAAQRYDSNAVKIGEQIIFHESANINILALPDNHFVVLHSWYQLNNNVILDGIQGQIYDANNTKIAPPPGAIFHKKESPSSSSKKYIIPAVIGGILSVAAMSYGLKKINDKIKKRNATPQELGMIELETLLEQEAKEMEEKMEQEMREEIERSVQEFRKKYIEDYKKHMEDKKGQIEIKSKEYKSSDKNGTPLDSVIEKKCIKKSGDVQSDSEVEKIELATVRSVEEGKSQLLTSSSSSSSSSYSQQSQFESKQEGLQKQSDDKTPSGSPLPSQISQQSKMDKKPLDPKQQNQSLNGREV